MLCQRRDNQSPVRPRTDTRPRAVDQHYRAPGASIVIVRIDSTGADGLTDLEEFLADRNPLINEAAVLPSIYLLLLP